jgi:8-oxo-dGTP pyrophosphatase MutT (NUDIX family)
LTIHLTINDQLRDHVADKLKKLDVRSIDIANRKHAAVAITVVDRLSDANIGDIPFDPSDADQAAFILTIRAAGLRNHGGQRAFPGGHIDAGETPEQSALRELEEEVGLRLNPEDILGRLDDFPTRSGFVITPVVVWGGSVPRLTANPDEVESIHRIPVSELMRHDAPILESLRENEHPVLKMPLGNDWFAAPTAAMAYQFREVAILGKETRVAHYEQPHFAWR